MSITSKIIKTAFLCASIFSTQMVFSVSDDDYLKQLEAEAGEESTDNSIIDDQHSDDSGSNQILDTPASDEDLILDKKELISDIQSFEKALAGIYPESYSLYQELTDVQKNSIYQSFTQNKRLYNSSLKIISTYLATH